MTTIRPLVAAFAVASLALSGCGGSDDSSISKAEDATTTTEAPADGQAEFTAALIDSNDGGLDDESLECIAGSLFPNISEEGHDLILGNAEFELAELNEGDAAAFSDAVDECVDPSVLTDVLLAGFAEEGMSDLSDETATCMANNMVDHFGGVGAMMFQMDSVDEAGFEEMASAAFGACISQDELAAMFIPALEEEGLSSDAATCIFNGLSESRSASELFDAFTTMDEAFLGELGTLGAACGAE
ncbi:MAG: hypothetical protein M9952_08515 [Microthrixaceae bacterium]|nr:hypothetical protein [Microthrixaceae bacterium]MCO5312961.1 hypothetical protein [Microthrixaceae bacterium]